MMRPPSHLDKAGPRATFLDLALLVMTCGIFAWLRWQKLDELLWGDPVHWLHEVSRVAHGELPYRDFSFQYPPFTAFFFGWAFRIFGTTFTTASILINFWSLAVVLLSYALTRLLLPPALRFFACFLLISVGATSLTNFNLFSYRIYSPALESGAAGALLSLVGMLRFLRNRGSNASKSKGTDYSVPNPKSSIRFRAHGVDRAVCPFFQQALNVIMIASGTAIALLSKPEFALASVCALALFAYLNKKSWWNLKLIAISIVPAAAAYAWLAHVVGFGNLRAGISGYGLATFACPWWPTGIGVFGVAAALGEALLIATVLSFPWRREFLARFGAGFRRLQLAAIPGALIFVAYIAAENRAPLASSVSVSRKIALMLPSVLWTAPVLLPVMWSAIALFCYLIARTVRRSAKSEWSNEMLLVLVFPVAMSPRTWFGSTQGVTADVSAACYPFLLILGPYLLWKFLSSAAPKIPAITIVAAIATLYGTARLVGGAPMLTDRNYQRLETAAGAVYVSDYSPASEIYHYVIEHTAPSDYVLEIPYCGGINFASGRRNPIFDTMLFNMEIPAEYQNQDLKDIERRKPRLIIAPDDPRFGTNYSFGIPGNRACVCPRLVWIPAKPSWDPNYVYPLVDFIARNYRPVMQVGGKVILQPFNQ